MARNEARRQKQLAKKKAKRDDKRTYLARQTSDNPLIRLANAEHWPIIGAWVPENLWSEGIGQPIIARRLPDGRIACSVFLVDILCLGVKNAMWNIMSEAEFEGLRSEIGRVGLLHACAPEYLAKLVYDSVAYAQTFGFLPHPDYRHARLLLAGIDPSLCSETFEFGRDGKPFYYRGPYESLAKAQVIAHKIKLAGGACVIPLKDSEVDPESGRIEDQDIKWLSTAENE